MSAAVRQVSAANICLQAAESSPLHLFQNVCMFEKYSNLLNLPTLIDLLDLCSFELSSFRTLRTHTNSMEPSHSKRDNCSDGQEIPFFYEGSLLYSQKPITGLSPDPNESSPYYRFHSFNAILPPSSEFSMWFLSFRFSSLNFVRIYSMRAACPAHRILLYFITLITFCEAPHYAFFCIFLLLSPS
jgi:hypothetical protein